MLGVSCKPLILASSSKIRKRILEEVGLSFEVVKPLYDEDNEKKKLIKMSPEKLAIFLAKEKALSVSRKFLNAYIIGSDQVCEFQKKEIPKSKNAKEALSQLNRFNGKTHFQNNAVVVAFNGKIIFENFVRVEMKMRKMLLQEIKKYIKLDRPWGCAGSYKYESFGKHLFERISGDYFAILGLAIQPLISFFYRERIITIN